MNKKGFTLVEILMVITIISIIVLMASFSISKLTNMRDKYKDEEMKALVEEAACIYIDLDDRQDFKEHCKIYGCEVSSNILIEEGLLYKEDIKEEMIVDISFKNVELEKNRKEEINDER